MTRKTTTKKPSQLDRIEKRCRTIDVQTTNHLVEIRTKLGAMDAFVSTTLPAMFNEFRAMESKLDLLLKGSEIGEKEEPWMVGDLVTVSPYVSYGPIQGKTMPIRDIDAVQSGFIGMTMPDGSRCSTRAENITRATPAEVQIYQEQVKAQEWARDTYETDRRSHLSRIQELEDQVKALREAGGEAMDLISSAQSVLERYLQPDGHTKERCMDLLIGLFDGPRQRKVESAWDAASKPSNNNTGS